MKLHIALMLLFLALNNGFATESPTPEVDRKMAADDVVTEDGSEAPDPEPQEVSRVSEGWSAKFTVENRRHVVKIEMGDQTHIFPPSNLRDSNDLPMSLSTVQIEGYPERGTAARTLLVVRFARGHSQRLYVVDPMLINGTSRNPILFNREISMVEKIETVNSGRVLRVVERKQGVDSTRPASYFENPWFIDCSIRHASNGQAETQRPLACQNPTQRPRSY